MKHAVVIGGGIAGLVASAVAADRFDTVTLIDKDTLPDGPEPRKAIPQGNHVHALLKSGEQFLCALFPGFRETALNAGCLEFRVRSQWRTYGPKGWIEPVDIGLTALAQTRPLIEHVVRGLVSGLQNVRPVTGTVAEILNAGDSTDVLLSDGTQMDADLVIDASGRGGGTGPWLAALGGPDVPIEDYKPEIRYASALFSRGLTNGPDFGGWLMFTPAPARRGAVAVPVESGRWLLTAYTRLGEPVPKSEEDFRAFLKDLPDPKISTLVEGEIIQTDISTYAIPKVQFRRFDHVANAMPDGYLPLGDTIATFSPINAQGMSVAALQAKALKEVLEQHPGDTGWRKAVTQSYLRQATIPAEWAWNLCQALDAGFEELRASISVPARDLSQTMKRVAEHAGTHPQLIGAMGRSIHLLESPETFTDEVSRILGD